MIIRYKFDVKGTLAFRDGLMYEYNGRRYTFELTADNLMQIIVSVKGNPDTDAPLVQTVQNPNGTSAHSIHIREGALLPFIQMEVRNLEGILSLYGIEEIDTHRPEIQWVPENTEEDKKIPIKNYKVKPSQQNRNNEQFPPDLMARAILASYSAHDLEVPLTFYRKATCSFKQERYLEACYDYIFFFESLYGDSKVKSADVKSAYKAARDLQDAIARVQQDSEHLNALARVAHPRTEKFRKKPTNEISDFVVDFRGEIHHYKSRYQKRWHPSKPGEAEFEATLFQAIAWQIAMKLAVDEMYDDKLPLADLKVYSKVE